MQKYRHRIGLTLAVSSILLASGTSASLAAPTHESSIAADEPVVEEIDAFDTDLPIGDTSMMYGEAGTEAPTDLEASTDAVAVPNIPTRPAFICSIHAGNPSFMYESAIYGSGFQSCTGTGWSRQRVKITIQKYKALGFWNSLSSQDTGYITDSWAPKTAGFTCVNIGTQTYRIVTDAWVRGGAQHKAAQSAKYLRVRC